MSFIKEPWVFLIAETKVNRNQLEAALQHLGVYDWPKDENDHHLLTEFAGKSCYMSFDTALNKNLTRVGTRSTHDYIQEGIIKNQHGSVLEHSTVTFFIVDVSRVVTHELIRHRPGTAFSQTSGRYVRMKKVNMYLPDDIAENEAAKAVFERANAQMEENLSELSGIFNLSGKPFAIKKRLTSAFRRLTGEGSVTNIVVTANHRGWRHMIEMRTNPGAEEEIRKNFAAISRVLRAKYPAIYADAIVTEEDGIEVTRFLYPKV